MTPVYWLEQKRTDLPPDEVWLAPAEKDRVQSLRWEKRREDWLLGRWTAKRAVARFLALDNLASIQLLPAPDGSPNVLVAGRPARLTASISHSSDRALCAIAHGGAAVGCDLETVEPHSDAFLADYFTDEEQALAERTSAHDRHRTIALLWSAKESVLKVLHAGLRLDTRSVSVRLVNDGESEVNEWRPFQAQFVNGATFRGWWHHKGGAFVRTLAAFPPPQPPTAINLDTELRNNLPFGKIRGLQACHI